MDFTGVIKNGMYISLQRKNYKIIENDIQLFRANIEAPDKHYKFTVNKFLNRIFLIMCSGQPIQTTSGKGTRSNRTIGINIKVNNDIINRMTKAGVYVNKNTTLPGDLAPYYMYFILQYCDLTQTKREALFYQSLIAELNDAVKLNRIIKIHKNNHSDDVCILPYELKVCEENGFHYITGFVLEPDKSDKNSYLYTNLINIPIRSILPYSREKYFEALGEINPRKQILFRKKSVVRSYQEMIAHMRDRLDSDGVLYLSREPKQVKVRLTDIGMDMLYSRTQYKPDNICPDPDDNHIVRFQATRLQTFLYFFKFGAQAEILEPEEYREFFLNEYQNAVMLYKQI